MNWLDSEMNLSYNFASMKALCVHEFHLIICSIISIIYVAFKYHT